MIILATITVAGAFSLQIFFLRHSYNYTERQFTESTTIALKEVTWQLLSNSNNLAGFDTIAPVEIISNSYYLVNVGVPIDYELLKYHIQDELRRHEIFTDFEFAVYNPTSESFEQRTLITSRGNQYQSEYEFPVSENNLGYIFAVHFPDRSPYFQSSLTIWYLFTGLILVIVLFFGYTMSVIIRQRQLSQIQKDFINNLTHELKTPISSIALSAKVINDEKILNTPERLFKYIHIIQDQNSRLSKNVEKVLNLASLEKSRIELNKERLELKEFLDSVVEYFQHSDAGSKASISIDTREAAPYVMADPFHFTNLVMNILENSVKYNERDPEISITASTIKQHTILRFKDNGIGISRKYRKKIFKRFFRVPTGNVHNVKGFGLGLDYVRKITKAHKWEINVDENPEGGSIFTIKIPLKK